MPGSTTPGTTSSGTTPAGTSTAGATTTSTTTPGTTTPGTTTTGTSTAGTTTPGSTKPGTTTPGTTTPTSPSQSACKPDDKTCQQTQGATNPGGTSTTSTAGRTMEDDGGCGQGSNAAKRMKAMYQCMVGDSTGMQAHPLGGRMGPGGNVNPNVAYIDPEHMSGPMPAAMACAAQGGDMPRMTMTDPQCAAMRCAEGQVCPCNRPAGLSGQPFQPIQTQKPVADPCRTEGCSDIPTPSGGVPINPLGGGNPRR